MKTEAARLYGLQHGRSFEHLFGVIRANGENIALLHDRPDGATERVTYTAFAGRVACVAQRLLTLLGPHAQGRFVGLHLDNSPEWPTLFWGLLMAGHRPLLLDFRATEEAVRALLREAQAVAVITESPLAVVEGLRVFGPGELCDGETPLTTPQWADHVALCTSGTSSASRLVVFDGRAFVSIVHSGWRFIQESPYLGRQRGVSLAFVPFFHSLGLLALMWYAAMGKTIVLLPDRAPATLGQTCRKHDVNLIVGVPLLWNSLASRIRAEVARRSASARLAFKAMCFVSVAAQMLVPVWGQRFAQSVLFRSLHAKTFGAQTCLVSAGARLPRRTIRLLTGIGFPLLSGYGMTEVGTVSLDPGRSFWSRWRGRLGRPVDLTKVRVSSGEPGGVGELSLSGECLHPFRLVRGELVPPELHDGWMRTGDLGKIEAGEIVILGRSKDTIIPATGENVQPEEVEEELGELPGVDSAAVIGWNLDDDGESVTLVVQPSQRPGASESFDALVTHVRGVNAALAPHLRISRLIVTEQPLPVTTSMKVKRGPLKASLESGQLAYRELKLVAGSVEPPAATIPSTRAGELPGEAQRASDPPAPAEVEVDVEIEIEIEAELRQLVAHALLVPADQVTPTADFIGELGADSLKLLELSSRVEARFGIFSDDRRLRDCSCLAELCAVVLEGPRERAAVTPVRASGEVRQVRRIEDDARYIEFSARLRDVGALNPYFVEHGATVRDTSWVEDVEIVNLASYNYLGLSGEPSTIDATTSAVRELGTSASGSRLLTGEKRLYRTLETELANWKGVDDALVLVSGHATNVSLVGNFCGPADLIVYDALSHNSVEQGVRMAECESRPFRHNDAADLGRILRAVRGSYEKVLIVVEGVYSMDGDVAPIPDFVALKHEHGAFLMVDEAHSLGVLGKTGKGVDEHFGLSGDDIDIRMGTLSKALGSCGGYLAGSRALIEYLRYTLPGFTFSVGISPANAAAALQALRTLRAEPARVERLQENIRCFVQEAWRLGFATFGASESAIIPILVGRDMRAFELCKALREQGIFVAPAVYPAVPKDTARLRFCVTSEHDRAQLLHALGTLARLAPELSSLATPRARCSSAM